MPKQPYINTFEDHALRGKTIKELRNMAPPAPSIRSVKTTSNTEAGSLESLTPSRTEFVQDYTNNSPIPTTSNGNDRIYETSDGTVIVQSSKDIYVTTIQETTEQKYITNQTENLLQTGTVSGITFTCVGGDVSKIGFDQNSGFVVSNLGSGLTKVSIDIPGNTPGGDNTQLQYNYCDTFAGIPFTTYNGTKLSLGSNTQVGITGGTCGQVLCTDGSGNLSWSTAITTPGGCNTQLQYNNSGSFAGIPTANYDGLKLNLGSNSEVGITGGAGGQVLSTDGSGNLSWTTVDTSVDWGDIGGSISNQADLQGALDTKADVAGGNTFQNNQAVVPVTLDTSMGTTTVNAALTNNFRLILQNNTTLANPTGLQDGTIINFYIRQDAVGNRVLSFGSKYKFPNGEKTNSISANATDFISCYYDATDDVLICGLSKNFT